MPRPLGRGSSLIEYKLELLAAQNGKAKIRVTRTDTDGSRLVNEHNFARGDSVASVMNNDRYLQGYTLLKIHEDGEEAKVDFKRTVLRRDEPIRFQVVGKYDTENESASSSSRQPIFNLIDRIAQSTNLTRPTINNIFRGLKPNVKSKFLDNPEGFANVFGAIIQAELNDHIALNIEYTLKQKDIAVELDQMFPPAKTFPQKELISTSEKSLYNLVQVDSDKEKSFVNKDLGDDSNNIVFFLKFPPAFKVPIPKAIGNYNPDWGILREYGPTKTLELIRETKGSTDLETLQFPNEKRKIWCAKKYFKEIGVDYRIIDPDHSKDKPYWDLVDDSLDNSN